ADHFLEKVDLTRTFWENETKIDLLKDVQKALTLYLDQTLFLHKYAGGKEVLSILTLYTIQDMLVRIEDEKNENILLRHPSYNPIPKLDEEPFFHLFHEKEIVRFNEIRAYYGALEKEKGEAFHHFSLDYRLDNSTIRDEPLSRICLSVIDQNPKIKSTAKSAFSSNVIKNLSDDVIAVAALHKEWSRFPSHMQGWIKALYQMQFLRNYGQQFTSSGVSLEPKVIYYGGDDYFSVRPYTMVHKKHLPYHSKHPNSIQESTFIKPYNTKKGREFWDGPREGTVLNEKQGSYLEKEIYWTASETDHHRFHLLAYYTGHLELFAEEHHQLFFSLQFFKGLISTQNETKTLVPFIKSPALLDLIVDFIEKGFDQFYKREPGKKPHLLPCLFFFRMLHKANEFCRVSQEDIEYKRFEELLTKYRKRLNKWLNSSEFTPAEKTLLHLHRIHDYECLQKEVYETGELCEIFASYFYYKNHSVINDMEMVFLEDGVERFVKQLEVPKEDFANDLGEKLCKTLGIVHSSENSKWKIIYRYCLVQENGALSFNLLTGEIFSSGAKLRLEIPKELYSASNYVALFQNAQWPPYIDPEAPEYYNFEGAYGKTFRASQTKDSTYLIEILHKDQFFVYIPPECAANVGDYFPKALLLGYHHFITRDKSSLLITDKEFNEVARLAGQSEITKPDGTIVRRVEKTGNDSATCFARGDYQLRTYFADGSPKGWSLPFYRSIHGRPLEFVWRDGKYYWSENSSYYVAAQKNSEILQEVPNALYLVSEVTGEGKILLPHRSIHEKKAQAFSTWSPLNVTEEPTALQIDSLTYPETTYFSYAMTETGELQGDSIEGALFYAYLSLHQGKFDLYLRLIKMLSPTDTLSEVGTKLLDEILAYPLEGPNMTPESNSLALKIVPFLKNTKNVFAQYQRYLQNTEHVSAVYRLTPLEEEEILSRLDDRSFQSRRIYHSKNKGEERYDGGPAPRFSLESFGDFNTYDQTYLGRTSLPETHLSHITSEGFTLCSQFFRDAWDTINIGQEAIRNRLQLHLRVAIALSNRQSSLTFRYDYPYTNYLSFLQKGGSYPYPGEFEHSNDWSSKVNQLKGERKHQVAKIPGRSALSFPNVGLLLPISVNPQEDRLFLTEAFFASPFAPLIEFFKGEPLFSAPFASFPEVDDAMIPSKYQLPVQEQLKETKRALEEGQKRLQTVKKYSLTQENRSKLETEIAQLKKDSASEITKIEAKLIQKANQVIGDAKLLMHTLMVRGNQRKPLDIKMLGTLFLRRSKALFRKHNPYLDDQEIQKIFNLLGEWNQWTIQRNICVKVEKDLADGRYSKAIEEMEKFPAYQCDFTPAALTFARLTTRIPRPDQIEDVKRFNQEAGCVLQKIMGGGKTSVDAALWGHTAISRGVLPVFIVHHSQKNQVIANLNQSQKTAFDQEVFTIEGEREDFSVAYLEKLLQTLKNGQRAGSMLIVCYETLDLFVLQRDYLLLKYFGLDHSDNPVDKESTEALIKGLNEVILFFKRECEGLGDECDLLLDNFFETNIPIGAQVFVPSGRVEHIRILFDFLVDEAAKIDGVSVRDFVGLLTNKQKNLTKDDYEKQVVPYLADRLLEKTFPSLANQKQYREPFLRFVLKQSDATKDQAFLDHLDRLKKDPNAAVQEEGALISLTKHLLSDLFPKIFKLSSNKDFG
ncbi:MAG: hypothetical protein KDK71_06650, partial [Chlamydiia bacterium]|nr:hypothetical protein [Chlamydiia bacterium]